MVLLTVVSSLGFGRKKLDVEHHGRVDRRSCFCWFRRELNCHKTEVGDVRRGSLRVVPSRTFDEDGDKLFDVVGVSQVIAELC